MKTKEEIVKDYNTRLVLAVRSSKDEEFAHMKADKILCDLLVELGYEKVVVEYNKVGKWYS